MSEAAARVMQSLATLADIGIGVNRSINVLAAICDLAEVGKVRADFTQLLQALQKHAAAVQAVIGEDPARRTVRWNRH